MRKIFLGTCVLISVFSSSAGNLLPQDVQKFIDRREGCDHMRGEIPDKSERKRMREVSREIAKLCKGTDRELAQLKKKYKANLAVMDRLNEFDSDIEMAEAPASSKSSK